MLEDEEGDEPNHVNLLMRQAMHFMMDAFQNLKAREALVRMSSDDGHQNQTEKGKEKPHPSTQQ